MAPTDRQFTLFLSPGHEPIANGATGSQRPVRLALTLDHRAWLDLLADEWWPLHTAPVPVRLGVGTPRGNAGVEGRIGVVAWIDPTRLPQIEVFSWRGQRWTCVPLAEVGNLDEEIVWPGPLPLFAITSFSVASQSDEARLLAMARGFSNVAPPVQPVRTELLDLRPLIHEEPPDQRKLTPPQDWNANRGAAAMAVWAVPAIGPWLNVLCDSLDMNASGSSADSLGAGWWSEPPWRLGPARDAVAQDIVFWRAIVEVLRGVRLREAWRPLAVLDAIRERAVLHGLERSSLDYIIAETLAILRDEQVVSLERSHAGPVGVALQLVLLRPTPDRFITWMHELRALPPVIWWTGAMLSGLIQGYRDLEQRFRGMQEGRRRLAVRSWQLSVPESARAVWPDITNAKPVWRRDAGKVQLLWDGEPWAERSESSRGRWFSADLKRPEVRQSALNVAKHFQPTCLRQRLLLANARVAFSGAGTIRVDVEDGRQLVVDGEVGLELPPKVSIVSELDEDAFRAWLVRGSIADRLPDPPSHAPPRAVAEPDPIEVPGLIVIPDFLSEAEERDLLTAVDAAPWRGDLARRVQHYGWVYDYKAKKVNPAARLGPLPAWAAQLGSKLLAKGLVTELPDQVIVNEYLGNQGIAKHVDCLPCFRGPIVTISLGESWEMFFWGPDDQKVVRTLERRSAVVLSGAAREKWKHEIPKRMKEPWGRRGRRVSITLRKVAVGNEQIRRSDSGTQASRSDALPRSKKKRSR